MATSIIKTKFRLNWTGRKLTVCCQATIYLFCAKSSARCFCYRCHQLSCHLPWHPGEADIIMTMRKLNWYSGKVSNWPKRQSQFLDFELQNQVDSPRGQSPSRPPIFYFLDLQQQSTVCSHGGPEILDLGLPPEPLAGVNFYTLPLWRVSKPRCIVCKCLLASRKMLASLFWPEMGFQGLLKPGCARWSS